MAGFYSARSALMTPLHWPTLPPPHTHELGTIMLRTEGTAMIRRSRPFASCPRVAVPRRIKLEILLRQKGRCADCGTRLDVERIVFDHRPPLALRDPDEDSNDPVGGHATPAYSDHQNRRPRCA